MKRTLGLLLTIVTTIDVVKADSVVDTRKIVEKSTAEWNLAFSAGRLDDVMSFYAPDAMMLEPNGTVAKGTKEIRDFWQTMIRQGDYAMDVIDVRCESNGTIVTTSRFSDIKTLQSTAPQRIRYLFGGVIYSVFKQQPDGSWKAEVQRWQSAHNT